MERFYVDNPRSVSSRIAAELALAPASSHLLVGGVGSGKTTELLATERRVAGIPDIARLYVDVTKQHDIAKMAPGAIIAQVGAPRVGHNHTMAAASELPLVSLDPDPVIDAYKKDVDRTLIRANLKLTVDERVKKMIGALRLVEEIQRSRRATK